MLNQSKYQARLDSSWFLKKSYISADLRKFTDKLYKMYILITPEDQITEKKKFIHHCYHVMLVFEALKIDRYKGSPTLYMVKSPEEINAIDVILWARSDLAGLVNYKELTKEVVLSELEKYSNHEIPTLTPELISFALEIQYRSAFDEFRKSNTGAFASMSIGRWVSVDFAVPLAPSSYDLAPALKADRENFFASAIFAGIPDVKYDPNSRMWSLRVQNGCSA